MTLDFVLSKFRNACFAAFGDAPNTTQLADEFFEAISRIPIEESGDRPLPARAFDAIMSKVEQLPANRAWEPTMIAADTLAACVLASLPYAEVARDLARRDHPAARTAAMRTYAKLAEFDTSYIDADAICELARRLDQMEPLTLPAQGTLSYLGILAGRLRNAEKGIRVLEQLARQRPASRITAVYAIAYDIALDPPTSRLSVFKRWPRTLLRSDPPGRRLVWLFNSLRHDADQSVSSATETALDLIRHSWPEVWKHWVVLTVPRSAPVQQDSGSAMQITYPVVKDAKEAVELALADLRSRTGRNWKRTELANLRHAHLARPRDANQPEGIDFALRFPLESNKKYGVLTWDPQLLEQETQAEAQAEDLPPIVGAPRLFISYRWSDRIDENGLFDYLAGNLFGRGYDIVFDRDPRHLDKGLSAGDVLLLLHGCTHFVPIVTDTLLDWLSNSKASPKDPLAIEWDLAQRQCRTKRLQWLSIWDSGEPVPQQLANKPVVDFSKQDDFCRAFPACRFEVHSFDGEATVHRSSPVERKQLRVAIKEAKSRPGTVRVEVHDITERDSALGF